MILSAFCISPVLAIFLTFSTVAALSQLRPTEQSRLTDEIGQRETRNDYAYRTTYWFSFGDSYTETGFNISGTLPSSGNPLGNPPYPGYTAAGGANWVDFLTTTYNNESLILTYNLAKGGATINSSLVIPGQGVSLEDEINMFLKKFAQKHPPAWDNSDTLFSVWIGINDINYSYDRPDFYTLSDMLLDSYFTLIERISYVSHPLNNVQHGWRKVLSIHKRSPHRLCASAWVWQWDSHATLTAILDDPTKYGFKDATSYGNDPAYVWGGSAHPGSSAHKIFAQQIGNTLKGTFW